jgi:O-antigen/teichoic acid export membrane protein
MVNGLHFGQARGRLVLVRAINYLLNSRRYVFILFAPVVRALASLIVVKMAATHLAQSDFGKFTQLVAIFATLNMLTSAGIANGIIREIATDNSSEKKLDFFRIVVIFNFLLVVVIFLSYASNHHYLNSLGLNDSLIFLTSISIPCLMISNIGSSVLIGQKLNETNFKVIISSQITAIAVFITIIRIFPGSIQLYLAGFLIFMSIPSLFYFRNINFTTAWLYFRDIKIPNLQRYAVNALMTLVSIVFLPNAITTVRFMISNSLGWEAVSNFQIVTRLSDSYMQIFGVFFVSVVFVNYSKIQNENDLNKAMIRYFTYLYLLMVFIFIFLSFFGEFAIKILFSDKYVVARDLIPLQVLADTVRLSVLLFSYWLLVKERILDFILVELIQCFSYLGIFYFFPTKSPENAILAYLFSGIISFFFVFAIFPKPLGRWKAISRLD